MLKKCLKYDLRAVGRIWWILAVVMMGAALLAGVSIRAMTQSMESGSSDFVVFLSVFGMLGALICFLAMAAALTVSIIMVYWRTYTHFFTDEGYLTFTLPVKRSTLYLSKVLTAAIIETATVVLFVLGIGLILLIAPPAENGQLINPAAYTVLGEAFALLWEGVGGWLIVWGLAAIPCLLMTQLYACGLVFLCLTIGSVIAKKHKLLAGIGIYFGVTTAVSFVGQLISYFLASGILSVLGYAIAAGVTVGGITVTAVLLIYALLLACMGVSLHFATTHLLEKKLNLA